MTNQLSRNAEIAEVPIVGIGKLGRGYHRYTVGNGEKERKHKEEFNAIGAH